MSKKTALYSAHEKLGGTMVDFGGFLMPMRYKETSIVDEHLAVRNEMGMFDTSHMGRIFVNGNDSLQLLNLLVPRNLEKLNDFSAGYSFMLNEVGGFRDDVIITRFSENEYMVVCNAGNLDKIWNWLRTFAMIWTSAGKDVILENRSFTSCMIAVQGPKAISLLERLSGEELPDARFKIKWITIEGERLLYSTTGYTGSSGAELILFSDLDNIEEKANRLWDLLLSENVVPCALGSRDTLRMEAGYRLYGNDIDEDINLLESGLDFIPFADINKKSGFIGQKYILENKEKMNKTFVGFKLLTKGIARHGYKVIIDGNEAGVVLSGTQSPITKIPFGMALVPMSHKDIGSKFDVEIRGKLKPAEVINFPIYDESKYGIKYRK